MLRSLVSPLAALLLAAVAGALAIRCDRPPAPVPADAPPHVFSGERARAELERLLGSGLPHPSGSLENRRIGDLLVERLSALGYAPQIQETLQWNRRRNAEVTVRNVLARMEGRDPGSAVALTAHYDSTERGPGATDDMAGVAAILEVARILDGYPRLRHSVVFLFTDAEEQGLLGARAFLSAHPWAKQVRAVVNLDAGGDGGASLLVETSPGNAPLVDAFASHVPHPAGSSLGLAMKRMMTGRRADSDFRPFVDAGVRGVYFAAVLGNRNRHTAADNLANLDAGTLQHHGENALAMVRWFAEGGLEAPPAGDSVFASLFSRVVVRYPARLAPSIAAAIAALVLAALMRFGRYGGAKPARAFAAGTAAWLAGTILAAIAGALCGVLLTAAAGPRPPAGVAVAGQIAILLAMMGTAMWVSRQARSHTGFAGIQAGVTAGWALVALAAGLTSADLSYFFAWPALAVVIGLLLASARKPQPDPWRTWVAAFPPLLIAVTLAFPLAALLRTSLGVFHPALPVLLAPSFSLAVPAFSSQPPRIQAGLALAGAATWALALAVPL